MIRMLKYDLDEILLAARAASAIAGAHVQLRLRSIEAMRSWATPSASRTRARADLLVAFRRASERLPGTCLIRALALQRLLAEHGHASELRIGVARSESGLMAHAWLASGDEILIGDGDEARTYALLAAWPNSDTTNLRLFR